MPERVLSPSYYILHHLRVITLKTQDVDVYGKHLRILAQKREGVARCRKMRGVVICNSRKWKELIVQR